MRSLVANERLPAMRFRLKTLKAGWGPLSADIEVKPRDREVLHPLFEVLRDRRALLHPPSGRTEQMSHVTESVKEIRAELTETLKKLDPDSAAREWVETLRAACREYLSAVERSAGVPTVDFEPALRQLRSAFYSAACHAAKTYNLAAAEELAEEMAAHGDISKRAAEAKPTLVSTADLTTATGSPKAPDQWEPELLRGRIFPNGYAPCVDNSETALAIRAGMAARLPVDPAPAIDANDERTFLDLVSASSLEGWAEQATSVPGEPWRAIYPSSSYVVTLRRPAVRLDAEGWELECRAFVTVAPYHFGGVGAGHGFLLLDTLLRPIADASPVLDLAALAELMFMLPDALAGQIGAELFRLLSRGARSDVLGVSVLLQSYGATLGRFVELDNDGWSRTEGSYEQGGGEWELRDYHELVSPHARAASLRRWLKKLFRDSGIRGHDASVDSMSLPAVSEPS
jgi:hypothetical protein